MRKRMHNPIDSGLEYVARRPAKSVGIMFLTAIVVLTAFGLMGIFYGVMI
jgi:hypothetical protein